jgi:hypothetical protein
MQLDQAHFARWLDLNSPTFGRVELPRQGKQVAGKRIGDH